MANKPVKILEISGNDWLKGLSIQPFMPTGGLFQKASNFNPFERSGVWRPTATPFQYSLGTNTLIYSMLTHYSTVAGGAFLDAFGISSIDTAKLYRINSAGAVSDISSRITYKVKNAIVFKSKSVYVSSGGVVVANNYPITTVNNETTLIAALTGSGPFCMKIAPDRNLYITNGPYVARVTSVSGTANNAAQFLTFEDNVITRSLDDDGQFLIIAGDTNNGDTTAGVENRCFVAFWNMKSQDLTRIWEFKDAAVFGIAAVEDEVIIVGANNIYTCSVDSRPKVLISRSGNTTLSTTPTHNLNNNFPMTKIGNSIIVWPFGSQIMGYGRIHYSQQKTLFNAYDNNANGCTDLTSILVAENTSLLHGLWVGSNNYGLYAFNISSSATTTQTATIVVAGIDFKTPYEFSFAKVILSEKLASGQSVDLEIKTDEGNNTVLRNTNNTGNSFSYSNFGSKKSHIFYPYPGTVAASTIALFEDLSDITIKNVAANVRRVEIWGKSVDPDQDVYK